MTAIITTPGKFQGEPQWVRDYWEIVILNAGGDFEIDCDDYTVSVLHPLDDEDRERIGDPDAYAVALWERTDGFVCHRLFTSMTEYDKWHAAMTADDDGGRS